ncbi:MAG: formate/nitrite transporter family protein [Halobacteriales archaeon]|nr:formate/nitrite transporter family protein [Halobacteriales archaeon]
MTDSGRPGDTREDGSLENGGGRSKRGAPAYGEAVPDRFSSDEVFQRIVAAADEEVTSKTRELFFSGVAAGFAISITFLLYASMSAATDSKLVASLLYPLGFIYIIIGGYQLYTENTLPPVALVLERLVSVPSLLRHWVTVLFGNFVGGAVGAAVLVWGGVFEPAAAETATSIAFEGIETEASVLFFKAVFAGLIVAGVVWVEYAARDTISRVVVVYLAFLAIPTGDLFHVVVSFTEVVYLVILGETAFLSGFVGFVVPVLIGNTIGGVVLVTVVNYFQTSEERLNEARLEGFDRRLSVSEWTLGSFVGRSYVPLLNTAGDALGDEGHRVAVPVTNPREDTAIVEFACMLASEREDSKVHVVHIVQAPEKMSLISGGHAERIAEASDKMLESVRGIGDEYGVEIRTSTISTHRSFEEIFDFAKRTRPDAVVMSWGEDSLWSAARAESPIEELTNQLPCDFLIVKDRGLDTSRVLLPTAGGEDSELGAEVARVLQKVTGSKLSLLHVVDGPHQREAGERFLTRWAEENELEGAEFVVDDSGDIEGAIEREAEDSTMLIMGATHKGLLSRLVSRSLHFDIVEEVDCTVLLAERPSERSIRERLFGRGAKDGTETEEDIPEAPGTEAKEEADE